MKKIVLIIAMFLFHISCSNTKHPMIGWVGETKQKMIETLGTPIRTLHNNNNDGEILVYAEQVFINSDSRGSTIAGPNFWNYEYMYVNKEGKIFSYRNEKQKYPPQAIDSQKIMSMNLLTVK